VRTAGSGSGALPDEQIGLSIVPARAAKRAYIPLLTLTGRPLLGFDKADVACRSIRIVENINYWLRLRQIDIFPKVSLG
jgi:hypothetical protein